jgi:hypothetical protein
MKNTAVYWLIKEYSKYIGDIDVPIEVLKKANEMEKEQIKDAYVSGYSDGDNGHYFNEDYYNETSNTNEK